MKERLIELKKRIAKVEQIEDFVLQKGERAWMKRYCTLKDKLPGFLHWILRKN